MIAYESVDFPDPFGPMIACTSFRPTSRSTPLTISVPSSSATWRFSSFSVPTKRVPFPGKCAEMRRTKTASILAEQAGPPAAFSGTCKCRGADDGGADEPTAEAERRPERRGPGLGIEAAVRSGIARERPEEVVGCAERLVLVRVLGLPAHPQQHQVARPRRELLAPHQLLRAPADGQLADRVLAAVEHGVRKGLGLVDRRHRLRLLAELLPVAVELRRVDRRRMDDRDVDAPAGLQQLDPCALEEVAEGGLRRAVAALQRDAAVGERRL